ncbi:unnamed protein product [Nesidiocoris tenuis]|uniref:60S ribosomal protein L29 n=2 Tax=Nesidiocoris tenuis TaxID=355587 RepID=A0A6H5HIR2_9HEMI|nr:ribosomal protein [Nesidiocoris tenuis]CAB0017304.1 unnamed protein product [Nesidiocoris tenuis]
MAKSKNHTNHNQNSKAHRNGITKPRRHRNESQLGVDAKFLKNLKFAKKNNLKPKKQVQRYEARKAKKAAFAAKKGVPAPK